MGRGARALRITSSTTARSLPLPLTTALSLSPSPSSLSFRDMFLCAPLLPTVALLSNA